MKKIFFFRSSTDKQVCEENSLNSQLSNQPKTRDEEASESLRKSVLKLQRSNVQNQILETTNGLRRCRSFSSAAFNATAQKNFSCLNDHSSSPSSSSSVNMKQHRHNHPSRRRMLTPERHVKEHYTGSVVNSDHEGKKPLSSRSSRAHPDQSGHSSLSSSNVSNEVLDLYIDGEQHHQRSGKISKSHTRNCGVKKPPKIHCTAPASPIGSVKDKPRPDSFRVTGRSELHPSSRDWVETGFGHESPQELAKLVSEKLYQTQIYHGTHLKDYDPDVPIMIEDVYSGSVNKSPALKLGSAQYKGFELERAHLSTNGYYHKDEMHSEDKVDVGFDEDSEDELDMELKSKFKEAKDRVLYLSEELEQESFLQDVEFNITALVQRIKDQTEEKISLALEVSAVLESQVADRASMKEQLRSARLELESRTRKLQKENNDTQSVMENELDRRSNDWSLKVERFQAEELRLRERVRELAEQNVSLQREVSSLAEMETERKIMGKQVNDLTSVLEGVKEENQDLRQNIYELEDKCKVADDDRICIRRSYGDKEQECKDLQACVTRLLRTCSEQEKTFDGLRGELAESLQKKYTLENSEKHVQKLQLEQIRLTGVEQTLRREIESHRNEVDSLRHENINLLNRLKACGQEGGLITFRLDEELRSSFHLLQNQGLSMLDNCTNLSSKLLECLKRLDRNLGKKEGFNRSCLDAQFIIESNVKVQGFKRGSESLVRSLQNISTIMHDKRDLLAPKSQTQSVDDSAFGLQTGGISQALTSSELRAEKLLTSLFRDRLNAKNQEVEQLQAEVADAVRGNDVLRREVQHALDSLSSVSHRMKELELQMMKKEEKIHQLQNDLQESVKELTIMRGILPKVTEERDILWEEVKQHSEKNMLLNSEVNMLKKKVEALDEDILLKEGQITILRDTVGRKSFDLLASPDHTHEFLLE